MSNLTYVLFSILLFLSTTARFCTSALSGTVTPGEKAKIKIEKPVYVIQDKSLIPACKNAGAPLHIPTYDGSGQSAHPKVLYFADGWNGFKYWMSFTPYPNGQSSYENPSISVSNDGVKWDIPKGLSNPVVKAPKDVRIGGYNSDPDLVMNGSTMELWFRQNEADVKKKCHNNHFDTIWRVTSTDGIHWTPPQKILDGRIDHLIHLSPAVLYENGLYKVWVSQFGGTLVYLQSSDLKNWSRPEAVNLNMPGYGIWHQDVIHCSDGYRIVFSAYKNGESDRNNQRLYGSVSADGLNFATPRLHGKTSGEYNGFFLKSHRVWR